MREFLPDAFIRSITSQTCTPHRTVRDIAKQLGQSDVVDLLQETLDEEGAADKKLTAIAGKEILPVAPTEADN